MNVQSFGSLDEICARGITLHVIVFGVKWSHLFCKLLGNIRPFGGLGTDPCSGLLVMSILGFKARMDSSHVSFHTCM